MDSLQTVLAALDLEHASDSGLLGLAAKLFPEATNDSALARHLTKVTKTKVYNTQLCRIKHGGHLSANIRDQLVKYLSRHSPSPSPITLEDCFLQDTSNDAYWSFLQHCYQKTLGFQYNLFLGNSQREVQMHHGYSGYYSGFFRGGWDDAVARVTKAFGKVPRPEPENFAETETEFLQRNVYNYQGIERTPVHIRGSYVHTIAFPWEASKELRFADDNLNKIFREMNFYVGIDWDSGLADIPSPELDPHSIYAAVQYSKEAVSIIFKSGLSLSKEPLMKRVYGQIC